MNKKLEFSKALVMACVMIFASIAIWSMVEYYILVRLAIESGNAILPDATLPVTCITTILGAILSYCLYQFGLKNSRNKYGVDCNGQPYSQKVEYEEFPEQRPVDYKE